MMMFGIPPERSKNISSKRARKRANTPRRVTVGSHANESTVVHSKESENPMMKHKEHWKRRSKKKRKQTWKQDKKNKSEQAGSKRIQKRRDPSRREPKKQRENQETEDDLRGAVTNTDLKSNKQKKVRQQKITTSLPP